MVGPDDVLAWIVSSTGAELPELNVADTELLERVVGAVIKHTARYYTAPADDTEEDWEQGHLMQMARLWGRRRSANGIADVNDFGPLRVTKLDHDVELMLAPFRTIAFS